MSTILLIENRVRRSKNNKEIEEERERLTSFCRVDKVTMTGGKNLYGQEKGDLQLNT